MTLEEAINHPKVNVFDIVPEGGTYKARTYEKPGEDKLAFIVRDIKNQQWAKRIKQKGRS